jgi:hypothetical protein
VLITLLDTAERRIQRENLLWIYALTTVGLKFRVWSVDEGIKTHAIHGDHLHRRQLAACMDTWDRYPGDQKHFRLGDAGALPTQSHFLEEYGGKPGRGSVQEMEQWPPSISLGGYGQ